MKTHLIFSILSLAISQALSNICPFEECNCDFTGDTIDIVCEQLGSYEFPKRINDFNQKNVNAIIELDLDNKGLTSLPDDRLDGLSINSLLLSQNALEVFQENVLRGIVKLKSIDLNKNQLKTIDSNAFKHVKDTLVEIKMDENLVGSMKNDVLSNVFKDLSALTSLDLRDNGLNEVPNLKGNTKLVTLKLDKNLITGLNGKELPSSLISLSLAKNRLSTFESKWFENLHNLQVLDLSYNLIKTADEGTPKPLRSLTKIDLSHNDFKRIPSSLIANLNPNEFDLSSQNLNLSEVHAYAFDKRGLTSERQVKYERITLRDNRILNFSHKAFCSAIHKKNILVDELNVGGNLFQTINPCVFKPLTVGRQNKSIISFLSDKYREERIIKCSCSLAYLAENFEVQGQCRSENGYIIAIKDYVCENGEEISSMCLDEEYDCGTNQDEIDETTEPLLEFTDDDTYEMEPKTTNQVKNNIVNAILTSTKAKSSSNSNTCVRLLFLLSIFITKRFL